MATAPNPYKFEQADLERVLGTARAAQWYAPLLAAFVQGNLRTARRQAHFLAQASHETQGFTVLVENLTYTTPGRIAAVFSKYFASPEEARRYENNPVGLANRVYANRMGNGPESSGDGWLYRGRGLLQHTGRAEYARLQAALGLPLLTKPDLLLDPALAARAAVSYWNARVVYLNGLPWRGLSVLADRGDLVGITRAINGGLNGLEDRQRWLARWSAALGV